MEFTFEAETEVLGSCSANYMGHMYVIGGSKETKQISVSKRDAGVELALFYLVGNRWLFVETTWFT